MKLGLELLSDLLGPDLIRLDHTHGMTVAQIYPAAIVRALTILRDHHDCSFRQLIDITAIDYPNQQARFKVIYNMLSHHHNQRLILTTYIDEGTPLHSITSVFECANWLERELWDLFGIGFHDHPDLRRILTDYTFGGHPLRKDFPLSGYGQVRYDPSLERVSYEPVDLKQPYRSFDFLSPWEGMDPRSREYLKADTPDA
ncbi:NADH-quinone oxidoreductase subunit C [Candidatus Finniella inopinata]|nr:NADH-quinone oxidoreductase subunit C [Candidatus Finniella inopinata]